MQPCGRYAAVKDAKKAKFQLGVSDPKLGNSIVEQTSIPCVCNDHIGEIIRGCRMHFGRFIKGLKEGDYEKAQLGLAHSYSRAKVGKCGETVPPIK